LKKRLAILLLFLPIVLLPIIGVAASLTISTDQPTTTTTGPFDRIVIAITAAAVVALSSLAAALAISAVGTAAVSALAEKPETFFRSFLVVALAEALAIYGLIMGILLWLKL
jgi:V/A-type H+-transporting ATPase subunit K